jgi:hypothetical protein
VETWNGVEWIEQCPPGGHYVPTITVIPAEKGGNPWATTKWVGAFWKDSQMGERIIASKNGSVWTAGVDDPSGSGSWLTLDANGGNDPNLWTDHPDDAENHQLPSARVTTVSGTGNILFRIGATSTNPASATSDFKYPDNSDGKPPRYATVNLRVSSVDYKIYCRQGEAADFVFTTEDTYMDPNATDQENPQSRYLARKFSPYNLTDAALTELLTSHRIAAVNGGSFTDFPTKAGAFFQWGMNENIRYAYHPTKPTGAASPWTTSNTSSYWSTMAATHETCPAGFRRPNDGITNNAQASVSGSTYTSNNIYLSEMRQSLYAVPKNGTTTMTETTGRAWGYYADGYFDRRKIENSDTGTGNSTVSKSTKDVAYIGTLFFNTNGNRSLFAPAAGLRHTTISSLYDAGRDGYYWNSSAYSTSSGLCLQFYNSIVYQNNSSRGYGFSVRCVAE